MKNENREEKFNIPVILGTGREGRESEKVAKFILAEIKKQGLKSELIDVRDFRIAVTDNSSESPQVKKFSEVIKKADAIIIVSPEYNHSYPGELKILLDMLYEDYKRKPVGVCGVSSGKIGGARVVEQLKLLSVELGMIPMREAVHFSNVKELFDQRGNLKKNIYRESLARMLKEILWFIKVLKSA